MCARYGNDHSGGEADPQRLGKNVLPSRSSQAVVQTNHATTAQKESMHRVVDDQNAWGHEGSIAEPVTRTRGEEIVKAPVNGTQRWFHVECQLP